MNHKSGCLSGDFLASEEDELVVAGFFFAKAVAGSLEVGEIGGVSDGVTDDEVGHHAAGFFGEEGDDFVVAVFLVFENGGDEVAFEVGFLHGGKIFVGGEVDDGVGAGFFEVLVEESGDLVAPEFVEVFSAFVLKIGAQFPAGRAA